MSSINANEPTATHNTIFPMLEVSRLQNQMPKTLEEVFNKTVIIPLGLFDFKITASYVSFVMCDDLLDTALRW